jgi:hypothetical protein
LLNFLDKRTEPEDVTEADFNSFVAAATAALSPFDYEIRSTVHQVSRERVFALVNSTSDPLTQLATTRTAEEIAFIKRILDAMFETYNVPRQEVMGVTGMQAMKQAKPTGSRQSINENGEASQSVDKGLSHGQVEALMASLVAEGWFERSVDGFYTLSARALMELKTWLVATYNDPDAEDDEWQRIKSCEACKSIVTVGQRCSEVDCNVRLHDVCQASFWRTQRQKKCPKCSTDWDGKHWVGEKAVTTTEAYLRGKRRSGGGSRKSQLAAEEEEQEEVIEQS